jgi:uncharacterized membrane protein YhaH (DUF805 family)
MKYYFLALQKYADFKGRATRKEFWYFVLFNILFGYTILLISFPIIQNEYYMIPYIIYILGLLVPGLAIGVRRMHDAGKSGWFLLIPLYNFILALTESENRINKWDNNRLIENINNPINEVSYENSNQTQGGFWSKALYYAIGIVIITVIRVIIHFIFN